MNSALPSGTTQTITTSQSVLTPTSNKRKPNIAKSLLDSSISFMVRAINTHNIVNESHRYEKVVLDIITAWEKAMKAFLHRNKVKLKKADGWSITFPDCLNKTSDKLGNSFLKARQSLPILYTYRNEAQHFFGESWDAVLFGLVAESVKSYKSFIENDCGHRFLLSQDLLIMPIGFQRPIMPQDFLTNLSASKSASREVKEFLKQISDAGAALQSQGIQDSVLVQFHVALINVKNVANADVIVGVDNSRPQEATMTVLRPVQGQIQITRNPNAQLVQLSEQEMVDAGWNLTWKKDIMPFIKKSLPHQKINDAFYLKWKEIKADSTICHIRKLHPGNPKSVKTELFNDLVYQRLLDAFPLLESNDEIIEKF
ncbi:hypothetical protein HUW51_00255 (plasmid) [Adhaeribacter swui]|uniref:DUF3644 domain-containing protein n=1 Tax=Adhaeribacter swui TaxID=2086471 RepID=A0A7G7G239_9BACT|nr:DUF3644 domain-containing protein [Adhaeribacter swui]QNF31223.1 hypothetical protein HUW51_00255 [Adhaeribacter swui]